MLPLLMKVLRIVGDHTAGGGKVEVVIKLEVVVVQGGCNEGGDITLSTKVGGSDGIRRRVTP